MVPNVLLNNRKKRFWLYCSVVFSIGFVFVQNKYTHSRPRHLSTNTDIHTLHIDSNAAFLFTLPLSFPLDIFARCHLWNTVETQRDVSRACLAQQAVGSLIKDGEPRGARCRFSQADAAGWEHSVELYGLQQLTS